MPACYACRASESTPRLHGEPEDELRGAFQRDRDRIIHSTAFRRLEYKTQVFANAEGDHFRTRLTHSLEVTQIARAVARALQLDEDLTEAVALAHDLGHPPFGHAGEAALDEALRDHGGFDHNLQTVRILTRLERRYAAFPGLNLTAATLEGVIKHNGPVTAPHPVVAALAAALPLHLDQQATLEGQVASLADDIAYSAHDLDDGARAGLFEPDELREVPLVGTILDRVDRRHPGCDRTVRLAETTRGLIDLMVRDLVAATRGHLARLAPSDVTEVRAQPMPLAAFSADLAAGLEGLRGFLRERVYRHYKVARMTRKAGQLVRDLVAVLHEAPQCLPDGWREAAGAPGSGQAAETVRDYIAGMTDRFALDEHDRLFRLRATGS